MDKQKLLELAGIVTEARNARNDRAVLERCLQFLEETLQYIQEGDGDIGEVEFELENFVDELRSHLE